MPAAGDPRTCARIVVNATIEVENDARARRCNVTTARKLERAMWSCHRRYSRGVERRANAALDEFERKCGSLPWQNLGSSRRRRRRRR